jgi:hypothetical protein
LRDLAELDPSLASPLATLQQRVDAVRQKVNLLRPYEIVADLSDALVLLRQIKAQTSNEHVQFLLQKKEADFQEAIRLASGLVLDVTVSDDTVAPGQEFNLTVSLINGGPLEFGGFRTVTDLPQGWTMAADGSTGSLRPGQRLDQKYKVKVPAAADYTQPFWLRQPRRGDRFVWPNVPGGALPADEVLLSTKADVEFRSNTISIQKPAEFRRVDRMLGEQRTALKVVPSLSAVISPDIAIVPLKGSRQKEFTVTVENQHPAALEGEVSLVLPAGWSVTPAVHAFSFAQQGERASLQFVVSVPATPGDYIVRAVVKAGGQEVRSGYTTIAYPHIETRYVYGPAESKVAVLDVATTVSSDSLRQLGINVTMLSPKDIATTDLSRFPAIVLGVRAYAVRDDLRAYNKRLLEYVSNGGTLIVQYNRANEVGNIQIAPYPITLANTNQNNSERVTREDAPVKIVDPTSSILSVPNRITSQDFEGWVDERGTFFLRLWDPRYVAPLSSADPEEPDRQGGLIAAKYGKGTYIYTGYSFFRQLPAGVKGAYRLFANLVSVEN